MEYKYLDNIKSPKDLKELSCSQLKIYAAELRDYIVETVMRQGGHLASNLGAIELTLALHYVFDAPQDKLLFDVGHQTYAHKIITGRKKDFDLLRTNDGVCGFPNAKESEYDAFTMGHSSTSLSVGLGIARARDIKSDNYRVVSVIGDGAFTGGMAFEALNDIGASGAKMIIVLNDNEMSISKNVGAISNYFTKLRLSKRYSKFKSRVKRGIASLPFFGDKIMRCAEITKNSLKAVMQNKIMFEQMGIKYFGPFDGHDLHSLIEIFSSVKDKNEPILIHVATHKGYGYPDAEKNPDKFHGVAPKGEKSCFPYSEIVGKQLSDFADSDNRIVAITAAMADGTGLSEFALRHKERYFDVGIAEQHAVTMAAGLAKQGLKPYFAVYSSFLQRGYDQIVHDVCLNSLPVTFLIDRAGVVGPDGVTHQGVLDISYLCMIPNITVCTPKDGNELGEMLKWSLDFNAPLAIRYPKGYIKDYGNAASIALGKWEVIKKGTNKILLCAGNRALDAACEITDENVEIVNVRFIKPLDTEYLDSINKAENTVITFEDNVIKGGFGESVLSYFNSVGKRADVTILGHKDEYIENLDSAEVLNKIGFSKKNIENLLYKNS